MHFLRLCGNKSICFGQMTNWGGGEGCVISLTGGRQRANVKRQTRAGWARGGACRVQGCGGREGGCMRTYGGRSAICGAGGGVVWCDEVRRGAGWGGAVGAPHLNSGSGQCQSQSRV